MHFSFNTLTSRDLRPPEIFDLPVRAHAPSKILTLKQVKRCRVLPYRKPACYKSAHTAHCHSRLKEERESDTKLLKIALQDIIHKAKHLTLHEEPSPVDNAPASLGDSPLPRTNSQEPPKEAHYSEKIEIVYQAPPLTSSSNQSSDTSDDLLSEIDLDAIEQN